MSDTWAVIHGDCLDILKQFSNDSVDAVVTDPPYGLSEEPDIEEVLRHWIAGDVYEHGGSGFMGKFWDNFVPGPEYWREVFRVLKPGGYLLAFAGTRTHDLMSISIRFAKFQIRDTIHWLHGTGFPKSLNVSKELDKRAGRDREVIGANPNHRPVSGVEYEGVYAGGNTGAATITAPASDEAKKWEGFGTAIKPAVEPVIMARKPLDGTVVANLLKHGTGVLNIDAAKIDGPHELGDSGLVRDGRWPANVAFEHTEWCEIVGETIIKGDARVGSMPGERPSGFVDTGAAKGDERPNGTIHGDARAPVWACLPGCPVRLLDEQKAGASRFFFTAKPSRKERDAGCEHLPVKSGGEATDREDGTAGLNSPRAGARRKGGAHNHHPTTKSIALMRWLVRLVTPPGGVVLDPFCGSGTTGCAAVLGGFKFVGIEKDEENEGYIEIANARISHWEKSKETQ